MNVLNIFNNNSWARSLNWDLEATHYSEPRVPFAIYVRPSDTDSQEPSGAFTGFQILPAELQIHILSFCDAHTLFQLMHVSSATRAEAKKLFWSLPDAWYHAHGSWLRGGGFSSQVFHAEEIQAEIQQVEVEFFNIGSFFEATHIQDFWKTLQHRFPSATRVVISEQQPRASKAMLAPEFQRIVQMSPTQISVYVSMVRRAPDCSTKLERSLWRRADVDAVTEGNWEEITPLWTRNSILLPPRDFCGPVGAYAKAQYLSQRCRRREYATRLLLIEVIESHRFDGRNSPFFCFQLGCGTQFTQRGEWAIHAVRTDHDAHMSHADKAIQTLRDEKIKRVDQLTEDAGRAWDSVNEYWGKRKSQKRHIAEQEFLYQLEHDHLYSDGKSSIWESITGHLQTIDGRVFY